QLSSGVAFFVPEWIPGESAPWISKDFQSNPEIARLHDHSVAYDPRSASRSEAEASLLRTRYIGRRTLAGRPQLIGPLDQASQRSDEDLGGSCRRRDNPLVRMCRGGENNFEPRRLPFDENGHLASHVLAIPSGPCSTLVQSEIDKGGDGGDLYNILQCQLVCLDRGIDADLVGYPLPEKYFDPDGNSAHDSFSDFMGSLSCGRVEFGFINYSSKTLKLYWVNQRGDKVFLYDFERLERNTRFTHTFIGHRFIAEDPDTKEHLMDHTVEFFGIIGVGNHVNRHRKRDIRREVSSTMNGEWTKHLQVKRTFSRLGFDKGRLPDDVFGSMRAFYYNNRGSPHKTMEEWDSKGLYVNFWESDCNFIQIPWELKFIWQERLRLNVQKWVGVDIEQTDLYGIRQYTEGARLLTHVDRITTHA
ncbi:hypothetical protein THAOC_16030, partial [Thalassiosira oceanica]